jgi:ADP-heptose:LPS heptosyltransferase
VEPDVARARAVRAMNKFSALFARHFRAFWYVLVEVLPVILKTGRRPVIFSRYAGLGDIINSIPAALELKKRHPSATFIYNCGTSSACLPRMGGVTNRVTDLREIGLVGYWYRALLAGYYSFRSDDDDLTQDDSLNSIVAFGKNLGVATGETHPALSLSESAQQAARTAVAQFQFGPAPLIIIHTGPSSKVRQWPREHWAELVQQLNQRGLKNILQLGARVGSYAGAEAAETAPLPGVFSLVEQMSLEESIALIAAADLYVGIDSGLLHAAASVRTPAVGLWGPTSAHFRLSVEERKYSVTSPAECQGCHHRMPRLHWETSCPHDIRCMKEISPAAVLAKCLEVLAAVKK